MAAHVRAVCQATELGVVVYHRANARYQHRALLRLVDECPNLIGFKDGIGDIELLATLSAAVGDRLVYVGGLPTAETYALPYLELGVSTYSSAIFNFAPEWAVAFYDAVRRRDHDYVRRWVADFLTPYIAIRNRRAGYAVSIVLHRAYAVAAVTDDDLVNISIATTVRSIAPGGLRVVVRAGDGRVANETRSLFRVGLVRDVHRIAAALRISRACDRVGRAASHLPRRRSGVLLRRAARRPSPRRPRRSGRPPRRSA